MSRSDEEGENGGRTDSERSEGECGEVIQPPEEVRLLHNLYLNFEFLKIISPLCARN